MGSAEEVRTGAHPGSRIPRHRPHRGRSGDDGAIYLINITNSSNGAIAPTTTISGGTTNIADPVDIAFDGTFVYTAEKNEDAIRRYNISGATPTAPEATSFTVDSPESITFILQ